MTNFGEPAAKFLQVSVQRRSACEDEERCHFLRLKEEWPKCLRLHREGFCESWLFVFFLCSALLLPPSWFQFLSLSSRLSSFVGLLFCLFFPFFSCLKKTIALLLACETYWSISWEVLGTRQCKELLSNKEASLWNFHKLVGSGSNSGFWNPTVFSVSIAKTGRSQQFQRFELAKSRTHRKWVPSFRR